VEGRGEEPRGERDGDSRRQCEAEHGEEREGREGGGASEIGGDGIRVEGELGRLFIGGRG
jgi:hypothetical protein